MSSPIVKTTIQSCVLNATSNLIAQFITAYKANAPYTINWVPVFQFVLFNAISNPPNFLWYNRSPFQPSPLVLTASYRQSFLESTFPSNYLVPSASAIHAASENDEKELDREEKTHSILESKLHIQNTLIKFLLDQTIGATLNTLLFSLAFAGFRGEGYADAIATAQEEFWPMVRAGWTLWPFVSLLNFAVVKSVEGRALVGSLSGLLWGIYLSLLKG
ncbi:Mpv17/PMP22 family protein [Mollisia scopiformis]|uniref:Mpv17/PMP22 family protein n=1 Tax=Mollisia scopiformis TaxID=149040 RepID=A0A194XUB4_MOLSC|nr:Mpv17/PMP22 family protein [Mollisia scopiformis]KUJ23297.1 Mpv17/PMP22 family protein [Mollisia scopiformis]